MTTVRSSNREGVSLAVGKWAEGDVEPFTVLNYAE